MSEIQSVLIDEIDVNPLRRLRDYPYNEKKIEALQRSIKDVGLWEGVIGRRVGNRLQIAFGHHRVEAARRELGQNARIPIIVRDLTEADMLRFMGRENLEDYNADFLVMLESWEATEAFLGRRADQNAQAVEIASLLGWTEPRAEGRQGVKINDTALACSHAARLVSGGHVERQQLSGLSVKAAREICGRVVAQHEAVERMAKVTKRPIREIEETKRISSNAGIRVADDIREGRTAHRDIRGQVDVEAFRNARDAKKQTPLFGVFANSLCAQIAKLGLTDSVGEKLAEIEHHLGAITMAEDIETVRRVALECGNASERFGQWRTTFSEPARKVVQLREVQ